MSTYQYVALRCVPRVEREEFLNVGVVLFCPEQDFLSARWEVDAARLRCVDPGLDVAAVHAALIAVDQVCRGEAHRSFGIGSRATAYGHRLQVDDPSTRFGFLKAPRSTVLQPGPVHGGVSDDPVRTLAHLLDRLVL
ncbi:MAG: DUF3037 domain-containing protein [Nocardioidaceae bacterium]|nr:DUF3037 domain-containing protein [Nocardioidaceae bacterium]